MAWHMEVGIRLASGYGRSGLLLGLALRMSRHDSELFTILLPAIQRYCSSLIKKEDCVLRCQRISRMTVARLFCSGHALVSSQS